MNHVHAEHQPLSDRHTYRERKRDEVCLLKVQLDSLSLVFLGDYANEGEVKGREDLRLI